MRAARWDTAVALAAGGIALGQSVHYWQTGNYGMACIFTLGGGLVVGGTLWRRVS